ncbi:MAG: nucleotidyltransferase domain-containing protein [Candidatus Moranbacteria bacterium]|nr:nucleotidyltransferase domain-containing protein [Candidatus Moranbacteria bacterium]
MNNETRITKKQAVEWVRKFIEFELDKESWYQNIKEYLRAVILYGSVAKGVNRVDSDIDVLFFLPLEIEEKYTTGEYIYKFEGKEINIVIRSVEKLRKIAEEKNDEFQKEVFRDSEIIWSGDGEIGELINVINS